MDGSQALAGADIAIVPVQTKAELERFIRLPMRLSAHDPNYIAPLLMERREALSPKHNPFFAHAEVQLWLAVRGGRDVGRISAQIDELTPDDGRGPVGHFGMIAAEDDAEIFSALFRTAEDWLRARGKTRAIGPFNLSINEEVGLLIDGFDTPPMVLMGHDQPYVAAQVEAQGYAKAKDVYAWVSPHTDDLPHKIVELARRGREGVRIRQLDMSRYDEEVATLTQILNDAWSGNWGFTPTTEAETRQLAKAMKPVIDPRMTLFAEIDGESAGFIVLLPNVNEAIRDLKGELLPFGWAKLLYRLKVKGLTSVRMPLLGVRRKFHGTRKGQLLPFILIDQGVTAARGLGYRTFEASWILEDNTAMNAIIRAVGSQIYKTYRIYEKSIA
ncbi:dATP pyrophosphohydrolase [Phenylobacterium deserti]|uniref:dATP pyrophosphohydrolase n=1 Tax=Phenylobacterium deserti TaxID=1914756 RepID=A0A328AD95_9CAUL|nr:dATP pyrophosphohydrolase [Phenylobacterium deserti]RAK52793.1 dATP pyrophosphohydrolase [Phenylobacterium deserti]